MSTINSDAEADAIRASMRYIRNRARGRARNLTQATKTLLDWKSTFRVYPWGMLGLAAAVGYWIVPWPRVVRPRISVQAPAPQPVTPLPRPPRVGVIAGAVRSLGTALLRAGMIYAGRQLGDILAQGIREHEAARSENGVHEFSPRRS